MDLYEELHAVVSALDEGSVPYALCGGLAVAFHGAPRFTKDIDFLIPTDQVDAAKEALRGIGFVLDTGDIPLDAGEDEWVVVHRVGKTDGDEFLHVDLIEVSTTTEQAWASRKAISGEEFPIWVISREALIEMKRRAGRAIDRGDIERLEEQHDGD